MVKDKVATQYRLIIVSPDETLFESWAKKATMPGLTQTLAILPDHTPLYAQLTKGTIVIEKPNGFIQKIPIESGIIRFRSNKASIIVGFDVRGDALINK